MTLPPAAAAQLRSIAHLGRMTESQAIDFLIQASFDQLVEVGHLRPTGTHDAPSARVATQEH